MRVSDSLHGGVVFKRLCLTPIFLSVWAGYTRLVYLRMLASCPVSIFPNFDGACNELNFSMDPLKHYGIRKVFRVPKTHGKTFAMCWSRHKALDIDFLGKDCVSRFRILPLHCAASIPAMFQRTKSPFFFAAFQRYITCHGNAHSLSLSAVLCVNGCFFA